MKLVGCCGFGDNRGRYLRRMRLVEVQETLMNPPKNAVLSRWREQAATDFVFTIRASQIITHLGDSAAYGRLAKGSSLDLSRCGHFSGSDEVSKAWTQTAAAAETLRAAAILFETPASFRPTELNRKRLRDFFESIERPAGALLVWLVRGIWQEEETRRICQDLDLTLASERIEDVNLGEVAYLRLSSARYSEDALWSIAERLSSAPTAFCFFNNTSMFGLAQRLQGLLDAETA